MKALILCLFMLVALAPASYCQEVLTGLVDSKEIEQVNVIMNSKGFTKEIRTKTVQYEYLTKTGEHVYRDYKVKGLVDQRRWRVKHPFLYMLAPLLPTLLWESARALTPLP